MTKPQLLSAAISAAFISVNAMAVDFHGYGRAGMSTTSDGGEQQCYGDGASGHLAGRLADECDTYIEISFGQELYHQAGKKFRIEVMPAFTTENDFQGNSAQWNSTYANPSDEDADAVSAWSGGDWAMRQYYVAAEGVLEAAPEATLWAGKRFYQRKDIHLMDWYYLNDSGYGVGIENVQLGSGQLSIAWVNMDQQVDGDDDEVAEDIVQNNKLDIRYAGIPVWQGATLNLAVIYGWADLTETQDDAGYDEQDGFFVTAEITHDVMGGFNNLIFQYSTDSMGDAAYDNHGGESSLSTAWWSGSKKASYRFIDWGVINLGQKVELGYSFMYAKAETFDSSMAETDPTRMSVVMRPMYKWDDVMKTTLELGYTKEDQVLDGESVDLYKAVIAQEWSAGPSFWSRPTIRLYAGAYWGDQAEAIGDDGNFRMGAQVEAWW